jgi:hypothetical protein
METLLSYGAEIAAIVTSLTVLITVIQLLRDSKNQNLHRLFYLHEYWSRDEFSL